MVQAEALKIYRGGESLCWDCLFFLPLFFASQRVVSFELPTATLDPHSSGDLAASSASPLIKTTKTSRFFPPPKKRLLIFFSLSRFLISFFHYGTMARPIEQHQL